MDLDAVLAALPPRPRGDRKSKNAHARNGLWRMSVEQSRILERILFAQQVDVGSTLTLSHALVQQFEPLKLAAVQRMDSLMAVWNQLTDAPRVISLQKQVRASTQPPLLLWRYQSNKKLKYSPFTDPALLEALPYSFYSLLVQFETCRLTVNCVAEMAWRSAAELQALQQKRTELVARLRTPPVSTEAAPSCAP